MIRTNSMNEGEVLQFKNGNINVRFSESSLENIAKGKWTDIEVLSWLLDSIDTYFEGDEFCLSNYDMGALLHDYYSGKEFIVSFGDINRVLLNGKTLKLYAQDATNEEV